MQHQFGVPTMVARAVRGTKTRGATKTRRCQTRVKVVGTYDMYTHTHGHTDYICMKILSRCAAPNHALAHRLYNSYNTPHPTAARARIRHIYVNICAMLFARAVCDGQLPAHCERDRQLRDGEQSRCGKFTYIVACAHTPHIRVIYDVKTCTRIAMCCARIAHGPGSDCLHC